LAGQRSPARCRPPSPRRSARSSIAAIPGSHCPPKPRVSSTSISTSSSYGPSRPLLPRPLRLRATGRRHRDPDNGAGQGSDHQQTRRGCEPTRAARAAGRGRSTSGTAQSTPRRSLEATSGMESKAVRHPRKLPVPQISRFCIRTLATTAGICRGQNGRYARASYASGGGGASRVPRIAGDVTAGPALVSCVLVGYAPWKGAVLICSGAAGRRGLPYGGPTRFRTRQIPMSGRSGACSDVTRV
jgi:hypothetical protein